MMPDPRIEPATPFGETEIARIEQVLGRALPKDYRDFVCEYGGAFVGGQIDGDADLPILAFFDADTLTFKLETFSDLRSVGFLPIADCELGNLYVMDQVNSIHYIAYYGGRTSSRKVADAFEDFLDRIVVVDE